MRRSISVLPSAVRRSSSTELDLAAVLFALRPALRLLVVVEFALDPVGGAVEEIDGRPEQIVEVGLEAGVGQGGDQGIEDVGDGAGEHVAFRQRPRVGLVLEGTVAVELEFGQDVVGRRGCVLGFKVVLLGHGMLRSLDRAPRGLHGDESRRAGRTCTRQRQRRAEASAEDGGGRLFCFAMESAPRGARRKIVGRSHCRPGRLPARSPSRRPGRGPPAK